MVRGVTSTARYNYNLFLTNGNETLSRQIAERDTLSDEANAKECRNMLDKAKTHIRTRIGVGRDVVNTIIGVIICLALCDGMAWAFGLARLAGDGWRNVLCIVSYETSFGLWNCWESQSFFL
jgi:hypothetical protein